MESRPLERPAVCVWGGNLPRTWQSGAPGPPNLPRRRKSTVSGREHAENVSLGSSRDARERAIFISHEVNEVMLISNEVMA